jgi:glutaminyl-peptide cyclotransferase
VRILASHPHDPTAFTQGLVFHAGRLYESTGMEGSSRLREVEIRTGRVLREVALPREEFGEGLALAGDLLVQLTWRNGRAHRWRLADFAPLGGFSYPGEGWGLAFDGTFLVMSDGSDKLTFRDPRTFEIARTLPVRRDGVPAAYLNELEVARGRVFANVWMSDEIVAIDPASGAVTAVYDAGGLLDLQEAARADILNGIAHDPGRDVFYLTGKWWPRLFEVALE